MIIWRPISAGDADRLTELDEACRIKDGDDPISDRLPVVVNGVEDVTKNTLGGESDRGVLVAVGWVESRGTQGITIGGKVHPAFRRQGLGTHLMEWAERRAGELLGGEKPQQLVITNESLSEDAYCLYRTRGYQQVMAEEMRVLRLTQPITVADFPDGITIASWSSDTAIQFFQAYRQSFEDRPGFPNPSAAEWINGNLESEGFRPGLSLLAQLAGGPVGFLTADIFSGLGWISQVGVVPAWRRKGLAKALIIAALHRFSEEGCTEVALHVNTNNPSAIHLYSQLGFAYRLKRARFVKAIKSPSHPDRL